MLSAILLLCAVSPVQAQGSNGSAIVSKMLARYAGAKSLVGQIRYTVSSPMSPQARTVDTIVQYQRPNLIYIRQVANLQEPIVRLVTCDGKFFSYDPPLGLEIGRNGRLLEKMTSTRSDGSVTTFNISDVYKASVQSLIDRSVPLDVAIARQEDLIFVNEQWATVKLLGKVTLGGKEVNHIVGDWRPYKRSSIFGSYEMFVTDEGDLIRFVRHETLAPETGGSVPIPVDSTWDANLSVNAPPDASLFKVVK